MKTNKSKVGVSGDTSCGFQDSKQTEQVRLLNRKSLSSAELKKYINEKIDEETDYLLNCKEEAK